MSWSVPSTNVWSCDVLSVVLLQILNRTTGTTCKIKRISILF